MRTLTLEHVLALHVLVIESTGGASGIREIGRLEAVIAAQNQDVFGKELHPTLSDKAAAVIRGLVLNHAFTDGNKRTAMLAGLTLLKINGQNFKASPGEIEDFAVRVATDKLETPTIDAWLIKHV